MLNERFTVQASSLGSYFGVGFLPPEEQLQVDLGLIPNDFDEEAEKRMRLGRMLEDGILNYFEEEFGTPITNRNIEVHTGFDGMLRYKVDGEMVYNGEPTVVEAKISNASEAFTLSKGYYLQCQAYMGAMGYKQCMLLGLYQGKPIYRLIYRNEAVIDMIKELVVSVFAILNGMDDIESYPYDIVKLYTGKDRQSAVQDILSEDVELIEELAKLKKIIKTYEARIDEITDYFKNQYNSISFAGDGYTFTVQERTRRGGVVEEAFVQEHPEIDLDKYRGREISYKIVSVREKKEKQG